MVSLIELYQFNRSTIKKHSNFLDMETYIKHYIEDNYLNPDKDLILHIIQHKFTDTTSKPSIPEDLLSKSDIADMFLRQNILETISNENLYENHDWYRKDDAYIFSVNCILYLLAKHKHGFMHKYSMILENIIIGYNDYEMIAAEELTSSGSEDESECEESEDSHLSVGSTLIKKVNTISNQINSSNSYLKYELMQLQTMIKNNQRTMYNAQLILTIIMQIHIMALIVYIMH